MGHLHIRGSPVDNVAKALVLAAVRVRVPIVQQRKMDNGMPLAQKVLLNQNICDTDPFPACTGALNKRLFSATL